MDKFLKDYYIPEIEKQTFHISHVHIIGGNECRETRKYAIKSHKPYRDIIVIKYYAENTVIQFFYKFNHNVGGRSSTINGRCCAGLFQE